MDIKEFEARIDTVYSICCEAIIFRGNYRDILLDENKTKVVFPKIKTTNPKITFSIDNLGVIHETTKNKILNEHNHDLYRAWMINFGIVGMTSVLEYFLKIIAEKISKKKCNEMGILYQFKRKTKINLSEFSHYNKIEYYYQVRHISMHNYARIDEKFLSKTKLNLKFNSPYVFFPIDLVHYKTMIIAFAKFILERANI